MDNVMYSKSGETNAVISFGFVVEAINCAKKVIEHAPPIVNAANYVLENGIKKGGYDVIAAGFKGILEHAESIGAPGDIGEAAYKGLQNAFGGAGDLPHDIIRLKNNIGNKIAAPKVTPKGQKLNPADANNAADALNHAITEAAKAPSLMGRVGGAALKGGIAGIVIGITTESLLSYQKYKNGEITGEEYLIEVAKSGGQMGITGAATAGIVTAISVPLAAAGLAVAPITVPISIVLGAAIDKVVAPAFGRGDYKKILDDAKYYQDMMNAHDDLIHAIEATENEFCYFINAYQKQMEVHEMLTEKNTQINKLHAIGNAQSHQQSSQIQNSFSALEDLYKKI